MVSLPKKSMTLINNMQEEFLRESLQTQKKKSERVKKTETYLSCIWICHKYLGLQYSKMGVTAFRLQMEEYEQKIYNFLKGREEEKVSGNSSATLERI